MSERDGFIPQSAVHIADPSFIGLQVENHDLVEALWYTGDLYQLRSG
jgi:hypothetical protein